MFKQKKSREYKYGDRVTFVDSDGYRTQGTITKIIDDGDSFNIISKNKHHWFIPKCNLMQV